MSLFFVKLCHYFVPGLKIVLDPPLLASEENDLVFPNKEFSGQALVSSPHQYMEMHKRSMDDPAGFWSDMASEFYWKQKWGDQVVSENLHVRKGPISIQWFKGGTNICYNCLNKNVEIGLGDKIAMYWDWEGNEIGVDASLTYSEFLQQVCQLANYLKDVGVKKGDAVVIYLPMLMELPIAMRLHVHGSGLFIRSFLLDFLLTLLLKESLIASQK